jgi:hypothetical protein
MATKTKNHPKGFIPEGTGAPGARFGRDPATNLAYKSDGTTRAARRTFTPAESLARLNESRGMVMANIGRGIVKGLPSLSAFRAVAGTFRKWVRDAKSYGTAEAIAERRRYYQAMLDSIDGKAKASSAWLPKASSAVEALSDLYQRVGEAFAEFSAKEKREPTDAEAERIVGRFLTADTRRIVESAADPANDPFAEFRRDAAEPESADEDEDMEDEEDEDDAE